MPEATLVALERQSWEAWKNRDAAFFDRFLSDDHLEVGIGGVAGKAAVTASVGAPDCTVRSYALDSFRVTAISDSVAVLTYHASQDTVCNGKPVPSPAWVSSVYVYRDRRWLNVLYQQTWR